MKRICLFLIAFTLLLAGCNSNKVKVRGKVIGLQGTVKLLAEMPGQQGLVILAQQDVTDGNIDLETMFEPPFGARRSVVFVPRIEVQIEPRDD